MFIQLNRVKIQSITKYCKYTNADVSETSTKHAL